MLIICPECNKEISDKCGNCPHCGFPIEVQEILYEYEGKQYNIIDIVKDIKENNSSSSFSLIHNIFGMPDSITKEEFANTTEKNDIIYDEIIEKYLPEYAQKGYYRSDKFRDEFQKQQSEQSRVHCSYCKSTNVKKISGTERVALVVMMGIFSKIINKSFKCGNCGGTF